MIGLLNDTEIKRLAVQGMITPFVPEQVRKIATAYKVPAQSEGGFRDQITLNVAEIPAISFGVSSYGADIRLSPKEFRTFEHIPGTVVDPKKFNPENLRTQTLHSDESGDYFIIPAHSYALGVAMEYLAIPEDITVICMGKSSYARCGIVTAMTPGEAGWRGHLTLEFSNSSSTDCRMYANEGVVQLLFFRGEPCETTYEKRKGKYQNQDEVVTLARV